MLRANGEEIKVQTDLLRNSAKVALEYYTQAIPEAKYAAQARVLEMIWERPRQWHIKAHGRYSTKRFRMWRGRRDSNLSRFAGV